jgi:nucleotide-binding universal stress UspA family protein
MREAIRYTFHMVFRRVLVGFDGSPEAERALAAALALRAPGGALRAVTIAETHLATRTGMAAPAWQAQISEEAETARQRAASLLDGQELAEAIRINGRTPEALLHAATEFEADLIAVGSRGTGRLAGVLIGSVATYVAHDARCSVLIAQGSRPLGDRPTSIVVGVDGSANSADAVAVAEALAAATGATLRRLAAAGGRNALADRVELPDEVDSRTPVEALVDASRSADLVIVGSRGVTGLAALGSVAERVSHQADCPVLIVRSGA